MTHSRAALRQLLDVNSLAPRRDLGQNFVGDPNTVRRIASLAGIGAGDHVVEVGAGLGSLTLALAESGARITAIEVDGGIGPANAATVTANGGEILVAASAIFKAKDPPAAIAAIREAGASGLSQAGESPRRARGGRDAPP